MFKFTAIVFSLSIISLAIWFYFSLKSVGTINRLPDKVIEFGMPVRKSTAVDKDPNIKDLEPKLISVPVLYYHYVEVVKDKSDTKRKSLSITPDSLESQIIKLINAGYTMYLASDIPNLFVKDLNKSVLLTFDDGYEDFYTDVFPILKKYNVKATVFVISGLVGQPNYLNVAQLKEISSNPLVEIGCHSLSHKNLSQIKYDDAVYEIDQGKRVLEEMIGRGVYSFAYPYGGYNKDIVDVIKNFDFTVAFTTDPGLTIKKDKIFLIPRFRASVFVRDDMIEFLENYLLNGYSQTTANATF
jgi:peptidoglycan/xylan/chitin deacetylase (PgdA/CDA1 family)